MNSTGWRTVTLQVCLLAAVGAARFAEASTPAGQPVPLNLRAPPIEQVMPRDELLAEIGPSKESIEIVAEPPLLPMTSDSDPPLGIVDSLGWSVDHPTQAWRLFLPANSVHDPYAP
jgi:hypothetical protein